ncbi:hypothetical protein GLOTRDRAFT_94929 [Gloeophyllum trabeum ATCC 11539]|uniref:Uncharacterized protein n=1 Tax=Gloeophyllum trabeum (strain ATCC 11539 / FP-39264 / Madison 617) TaxID=670483 RepID=S7Q2J5_GLOTA|nr:uncharacterized protein GLOTRDRAFT_94929 [Gloeophyllum trabeum ATCC 11539]EPQ53772.1 hypothetical protein GLOTRDRAFT_94929 [Gloeophyllum trabeum ATCC 11539]
MSCFVNSLRAMGNPVEGPGYPSVHGRFHSSGRERETYISPVHEVRADGADLPPLCGVPKDRTGLGWKLRPTIGKVPWKSMDLSPLGDSGTREHRAKGGPAASHLRQASWGMSRNTTRQRRMTSALGNGEEHGTVA